MDRALMERLIGAAILVAVVVILAPALLDGVQENPAPVAGNTAADAVRPATKVVVLKTPQPAAPAVDTVRADPAAVAPAAGPAPRTEQVPSAPVAPAAAPTRADRVPPEGFAVQLGSFAERANAERYAAKVSAEGFAVFVVRAAADNLQVYRVYVGPEDSREQAGSLAERLQARGHSVMVVQLDGKRG